MATEAFTMPGAAGELDRQALAHEVRTIFTEQRCISQGINGRTRGDQGTRRPGGIQDIRKAAAQDKLAW
jgi:hypothetical protein